MISAPFRGSRHIDGSPFPFDVIQLTPEQLAAIPRANKETRTSNRKPVLVTNVEVGWGGVALSGTVWKVVQTKETK